jgi:hypothetical protein
VRTASEQNIEVLEEARATQNHHLLPFRPFREEPDARRPGERSPARGNPQSHGAVPHDRRRTGKATHLPGGRVVKGNSEDIRYRLREKHGVGTCIKQPKECNVPRGACDADLNVWTGEKILTSPDATDGVSAVPKGHGVLPTNRTSTSGTFM